MTREEASNMLYGMRSDNLNFDDLYTKDKYDALDMAIKALKQDYILEKIRAEIDGLTYYWCEVNPRSVIDDVLKIIDKYKSESEIH